MNMHLLRVFTVKDDAEERQTILFFKLNVVGSLYYTDHDDDSDCKGSII